MTAFILSPALGGCGGGTPLAFVHTPAELEISKDPTVVYSNSDQWRSMQLYGIGLGAPEAQLPRKKIRNRNDAGWVEMRNGARYLVKGGKVAGLGVWDQKILSKLAIKSPNDIELKFGKPESVDDLGKEQIYRYQGNHLRVMWNNFERRVTTVNVVE
jgi:hypothetical protein